MGAYRQDLPGGEAPAEPAGPAKIASTKTAGQTPLAPPQFFHSMVVQLSGSFALPMS